MELENKVMIITGASGGIGAATARLLDEAGMQFVLTGRNADKLQALGARLNNAVVVAGDLTEETLPALLVQTALDRFGRLDAVFNNAGVMHVGSIEESDIDTLCAMVRLNVEATVRMSYTALKHFKQQGSGFLINTSSLAGLKTFAQIGVYNGTKFAVEAMTDALRMELAGTGVRVAAIEPGRTATGLFDHWPSEKKFNTADGMLAAEDVARCVRFILEQPEDVLISRLLVVPARQPR